MNQNELVHYQVGDPNEGPFVLVLNDGALITAEDRAMLQALYSRSPASVLNQLEKLAQSGSGKFMESFYVGYGHKSIGDCGHTTIFIENVSMLVAKAIQDSMLYDGQEVSTRYIDFTTQPFVDPLEIKGDNPQDKLRAFYVKALPKLKEYLKSKYPLGEGEKESVYEKAIAARAFDILRGFLPAGAQTCLAWTTNLRQAADRLVQLQVHPLHEVRNVAEMILEALKKAHPHSFNHKVYEASETYRSYYMQNGYYFEPLFFEKGIKLTHNSLDQDLLLLWKNLLQSRPQRTELPKFLGEIGTLQFEFTLDFGSFRDIARQRAVIQRMPLLTVRHGFHEWYLNELPEELFLEACTLLQETKEWWWSQLHKKHNITTQLQYYLPMGYRVPCRIVGDIPALVYLIELRSGATVHATLRELAQEMGAMVESLGIPLYVDRTESGRFDLKRGTQDIVQK